MFTIRLILKNQSELYHNLFLIIGFFENLMKTKKPLPRKFHVCTYTQNFNTMLRIGVIILESINPRETMAITDYMGRQPLNIMLLL